MCLAVVTVGTGKGCMEALVGSELLTNILVTGKAYLLFLFAKSQFKWCMGVGVTSEAVAYLEVCFSLVTHAALRDNSLCDLGRMSNVTVLTANSCLVGRACPFYVSGFLSMTHNAVIVGQLGNTADCSFLCCRRNAGRYHDN